MTQSSCIIRQWDTPQPYLPIWEAMQSFTLNRTPDTPDEVWLLEHQPVFTLGQAGLDHHIINPHDIPVVRCDRGGQVTYHGPGQLMIYTLFDLKRREQGIRHFVRDLEALLIELLSQWDIQSHRQQGAPGIYVDNQKIASIGLRVKRGCSYHGMALNVDMDLTPFQYINPCGFSDLKMTQVSLCRQTNMIDVTDAIQNIFQDKQIHLNHPRIMEKTI